MTFTKSNVVLEKFTLFPLKEQPNRPFSHNGDPMIFPSGDFFWTSQYQSMTHAAIK